MNDNVSKDMAMVSVRTVNLRYGRSLAMAMLMLSVAACESASSTIARPSTSFTHYMVERDVVVRRTESAGGDEIARLPAGTVIAAWIEDREDNWVLAHLDDGKTGYIFGKPLRQVP